MKKLKYKGNRISIKTLLVTASSSTHVFRSLTVFGVDYLSCDGVSVHDGQEDNPFDDPYRLRVLLPEPLWGHRVSTCTDTSTVVPGIYNVVLL